MAPAEVHRAVGTADESTVQFEYDDAGRRTAQIDPRGVRTEYAYDQLGQLTSLTQAAGLPEQAVTGYQYDNRGQLIDQIDPLGHVTHFEYDALGRRTHAITVVGDLDSLGAARATTSTSGGDDFSIAGSAAAAPPSDAATAYTRAIRLKSIIALFLDGQRMLAITFQGVVLPVALARLSFLVAGALQ